MSKLMTETHPDNMGILASMAYDMLANFKAEVEVICGLLEKIITDVPMSDQELLELAFLEFESMIRGMYEAPMEVAASILQTQGVELKIVPMNAVADKTVN